MYHKSESKGAPNNLRLVIQILSMGVQILMSLFLWQVTEDGHCPPVLVGRGNRNTSSEAENDQLSPIVCWSLSISKSFRLIPYANKFRLIICLKGWSSVCCNLEVTKGQMNTSYWTPGPLLQVRENSFGKSLIESKQMTSSWRKSVFSGTFNFKEW